MFEDEEWRIIDEFPRYKVSNCGRVKHIDRVEARQVSLNKEGSPILVLFAENNPTRYLRQVNKLVAIAFCDEPYDDRHNTIWHIDGNLTNCRADNLKWEMRAKVLEWNEMHRRGRPSLVTPRVKNNRTGKIYDCAYDCAMDEGVLESYIVSRIERQARHDQDDAARYRYIY